MIIHAPSTLVEGEYTLRVSRSDGTPVRELRFENLITNLGLDSLAATDGGGIGGGCRLTTSNAAPSITDVAMGGTSVLNSGVSPIFPDSNTVGAGPTYEITHTRGYRFNAGVATGTWASIGVTGLGGPNGATAPNNIASKTLIRDLGGNPTTLTVLAGEILDVQYTLRSRAVYGPVSGTMSGVGYTYSGSQATLARNLIGLHYNYSATLWGGPAATAVAPAVTVTGNSFASGATVFAGGSAPGAAQAYANGSFTRDVVFTFPSTTVHPNNQITGVVIGYGPAAGCLFAPYQFITLDAPITKTNLQTASFTMRYSWGRL
jgi:hypothetical protein